MWDLGQKIFLILLISAALTHEVALCQSIGEYSGVSEPTPSQPPSKNSKLVRVPSRAKTKEVTLFPSSIISGLHAAGIGGSYKINPSWDLILLAQKTTGARLGPASFSKGRSIFTASFGARYFFSSSFYFRAAIGYRDAQIANNASVPALNSTSGPKSVRDRHAAVEYSVGNRWSWDRISLVAEWIGGGSSVLGSNTTFDNYSEHDKDMYERSDRTWTRDQIELLKIGIGLLL